MTVSIIIPVYNTEKYIAKCLDYVFRQTYKDFGLIVVNDGSTDKSEEIILEFSKQRNFVYVPQVNQGANPARNNGAKYAAGEYLLFLDSDCYIHPTFLEVMVSALNKSDKNTAFVYSDFILKYSNMIAPFISGKFDPRRLRKENYINMISLMERQCFKEVGGFDPAIKGFQDWDLWLSFLDKGWVGAYIKTDPLLVVAEQRDESISKDVHDHWIERKNAVLGKHGLPLEIQNEKPAG